VTAVDGVALGVVAAVFSAETPAVISDETVIEGFVDGDDEPPPQPETITAVTAVRRQGRVFTPSL
jgi:hypothetical protein